MASTFDGQMGDTRTVMALVPWLILLVAMCTAHAAEWTSREEGQGYAAGHARLLLPQEGMATEALQLSYPWHVQSTPGHFAEWSCEVTAPGDECSLTYYIADDFAAPVAGYHILQVLVGDKVVRERDVAGGSMAADKVSVALPEGTVSKGQAVRVTFRLLGTKLVTNFGVSVRIAGVNLVCGDSLVPLLPLKAIAAGYETWPDDIELPALPFAEGWSQTANIVQPWGQTQTRAILEHEEWAPKFAKQFGFNAIIMLPPDAHNAITVPRGKQGVTEEQFRTAVEAYRANGIRLILYTSVMHCGHDPQWQFGDLTKQHPEWSMRDPAGKPVTMYGQEWLCPSTGALEHTLQYTEGLLREYGPDAVMLDNSEFMTSEAGGPTCYCAGCKDKFAKYVAQRFGEEKLQALLGLSPDEISIPESEDDPTWGLWLAWRKRTWAEAMETYRVRLRQINPDIVVLANTQYRYSSWMLAVDEQYAHEDALLAESRSLSTVGMASKMVLGKALAQGRPLWNYIGTFDEKDFTLLRDADTVAGICAASNSYGANPWIVFYGFTGEQNRASIEVLERYQDFWRDHAASLVAGADTGDVAVLMSPESRDLASEPMPDRWLDEVLAGGFAVQGIWTPMLNSAEHLSDAQVVVATSSVCMRDRVAAALIDWVRQGGKLIIRSDTGWRDEYGRWRAEGALAQAAGAMVNAPGEHAVGEGAVYCIETSKTVPAEVSGLASPRLVTEKAANISWRKAADGSQILAVALHEPGAQDVSVRVPAGVAEVRILQPGDSEGTVKTEEVDGETVVRFRMDERLAVLSFELP